MSGIISEDVGREFPFPRVNGPRTASSSGGSSLPSRSDSNQSKSLRSASSSGSPHSLPRTRLERELHDGLPGVSSKLLSRLMPRDHHDTPSLRTVLAVTTERLESETRRADDAERRVLEVLRKLRTAHEATMLAQAEASRAKEELVLFKYRFEDAQREILRAQELLNELEQQKLEAEAEAARARSTARRYREQQLIARAREEGRQEGFQEGLSRGKDMGYGEAAPGDERRHGERTIENVAEEEEPPPRQYRSRTPGPTDMRARTPAFEYRRGTPGPGPSFVSSSGRVTPPQPRRPPSQPSTSRASQRTHIPDTAHYAATLPVPTLVTPMNLPSPSHSRADTPTGMPIAHPAPQSLDEGEVPPPITIHEPVPSPSHPPVAIPPDGWIPYADQIEGMFIPPSHELSRPVSPVSPTPPPAPILYSAEPLQPSTSSAPPEFQVRARDYPFAAGIPPAGIPIVRSNARTMSPQSKASTSISQFDLVGAPKGRLRVSTQARSTKEDRQVMSPRGPRPRDDLPVPVRASLEREDSSGSSRRSERVRLPMNPIEKLFKKRHRDKSLNSEPPPLPPPPVVPDIVVESPSTPSTNRSSIKSTITHPHFLSPEPSSQPLVPAEPEVIVMRTEIPDYYPQSNSQNHFMPPPTEFDDAPVIPPPPDGQFPPGFVPLTPPMPVDTLAENPVPVPSNTPIPVPPPNNPIYVPPPRNVLYVPPPGNPLYVPPPGNPVYVPSPGLNRNPVPVPADTRVPGPSSDPTPVPSREAIPVPHREALPIPYDESLPIPQRSSTRQERYNEAPIPAGVVYPNRSNTPSGSGSLRRAKRGGIGTDVRSPGERLSPLPLQFQFFAPLRSDTTTSDPWSPKSLARGTVTSQP